MAISYVTLDLVLLLCPVELRIVSLLASMLFPPGMFSSEQAEMIQQGFAVCYQHE